MGTKNSETRRRILSVTLADCELQTFAAGGKGGQRQNTCNTGVRIIHRESGARGEARDDRSQARNKRNAWLRMVNDPKFQLWLRRALGQELVRESELRLPAHEVKIEVRRGGQWVQVQEHELTQ